jgi:exodeoxyribonuclease VII small subunit
MAKKFDFEKSLAELQNLVEEMESGELSLDQSLTKFEKGVALTKNCQEALKKAEQKVNILLEKHGETTLEAFLEEDE